MEKSKHSKKWLWVLAVILLLGAIGHGSSDKSSQQATSTDKTFCQANPRAKQCGNTFESRTSGYVDPMQSVNEKVISDAKREYQIASSSGTPVDRCVHAGLVAAAYLQAQDQSNYQQWKMREDSDCNYTSTR